MMKPFFLIKEKETDECDEDTEFTVPLITAFSVDTTMNHLLY